MREIKFRGKDKQGRWWKGDLRHTMMILGKPHCRIVNVDKDDYDRLQEIWSYRIQEDTICQFTSLYDRNKKEIYEGDLLKLQDDDTGLIEVRFVRGVFAFLWQGDLDDELPINAPTHEWATVAGNIHDNPELLKGDEK